MTASEEQEERWVTNGVLSIIRGLVKRYEAESPLECTLTCAEGSVGRISFDCVGDTVRVLRKFEAAPDAPDDASVFPLLVTCIDARGRKFNVVMDDPLAD